MTDNYYVLCPNCGFDLYEYSRNYCEVRVCPSCCYSLKEPIKNTESTSKTIRRLIVEADKR